MRRGLWLSLRCAAVVCWVMAAGETLLVIGSFLMFLAGTQMDPDEPVYWGSTIAAVAWAVLWGLAGLVLWRSGGRARRSRSMDGLRRA